MELTKNISKFIATISEIAMIRKIEYSSDNQWECRISVWESSLPLDVFKIIKDLEIEGVIAKTRVYADDDHMAIYTHIIQNK